MQISSQALHNAIEHAQASPDKEVCGMFVQRLDSDIWYLPMVNTSKQPALHFEISVDQMIDVMDEGMDLVALFHSHPNGRQEPSAIDIQTFPVHYVDHGLIYAFLGSGVLASEVIYYNAVESKVVPLAAEWGVAV